MSDLTSDVSVDTRQSPQFRVRTNTGRNSSGVTFEVTTSMTWSGSPKTYYLDGDEFNVDLALRDLNERAHAQIDERIEQARVVDTFVPKPPKAG